MTAPVKNNGTRESNQASHDDTYDYSYEDEFAYEESSYESIDGGETASDVPLTLKDQLNRVEQLMEATEDPAIKAALKKELGMLKRCAGIQNPDKREAKIAEIAERISSLEGQIYYPEGEDEYGDASLDKQIDQYLKDHDATLSDKDKVYLEKLKATLALEPSAEDRIYEKFDEFVQKELDASLCSQSAVDIAGSLGKDVDPQSVQDILDQLKITANPILQNDFSKLLSSTEFQEMVPGLAEALEKVTSSSKATQDAITTAMSDAQAVNSANRGCDNSSLVNLDFSAFKTLWDIKNGQGPFCEATNQAMKDLSDLLAPIFTAATGETKIPTSFINAKSGDIEIGNSPIPIPEVELVPMYAGEDTYGAEDWCGAKDWSAMGNCPDWARAARYPVSDDNGVKGVNYDG